MVTSVSGYESRYTDRETLEIFEMVYCGKINKGIVEKMQKRGINAVGLSGVDGRIWEGIRKSAITIIEDGKRKVLRGDHTGRVERVNLDLIQLLLEHGYTPVLSPPAISYQGEARPMPPLESFREAGSIRSLAVAFPSVPSRDL